MPLVTTEISEGVAIVTLNRPEAMNALSKALRAELAEAMLALANDDAVRAVGLERDALVIDAAVLLPKSSQFFHDFVH